MSDEKFEEFLQREAPSYNTPPSGDAPRDEMWQVIAAARAGRRTGGAAADTTPTATRSTRPMRWRIVPWIGMAATLLLGVGIGRFALDRPNATSVTQMGTNGQSVGAQLPTPATSLPATGLPEVAPPGTARPANAAAIPLDVSPRRVVTSAAPPVRFASLPPGGTLDPSTPMQVASREHLVRAEALISLVSASAADLAIDSLTSRWARDMLSGTRLLLDSPASEDPLRRQLLEDLETVLVQLVQRSGAPADERALLDRSLQRTQLLTRLRTNAAGL